MRVYVHHTAEGPGVSDATLLALSTEKIHHRTNEPPYRPEPLRIGLILVPTAGLHGYGDSLKTLWEMGETFITLEQDVVPWVGALTEMWNCPHSWCALPQIVHGCVNETNIGCVKFDKAFIKEWPNLWHDYPRNEVFYWSSLDSWLYQYVKPLRHHRHPPPALHMNWSAVKMKGDR